MMAVFQNENQDFEMSSSTIAMTEFTELDVQLQPKQDQRLGLWLMGGKDQGFPPVVESVQNGLFKFN